MMTGWPQKQRESGKMVESVATRVPASPSLMQVHRPVTGANR